MKPLLTLIMTGLLTTGSALAQERAQVHVFKLEDCLSYAYEHQNTILNAKLDEQTASAKVKETLGIGLPQVNGEANFQHFMDIPTTIIPDFISPAVYGVLEKEGVEGNNGPITKPSEFGGVPAQFGTKNTFTATLSISQLLFDGTYLMGLKAAKVYKELSTKNVKRTQIDTKEAVSKAYYSVIVNNAYLNTVEISIERLREAYKQTEALNKSGFAEKIDVERIKVLLNNAETQKKTIKRLSDLNAYLLKYQMGMPVTDSLVVNQKLEDMKLDAMMPSLEGVNVENRIEYSLLQTQKRLLEYDLKRYKLAYVPSVAAYASFGQTGQNNSFIKTFEKFFPTNLVGVRFSIPLWSSGQRQQRINMAKFNLTKTENDMVNLKNTLNLSLKNAAVGFENNKDEVDNQNRNLELAREVARVTKIKYNQGVGSSLEVTTAETDLKSAENNYYTAVYSAILSWIELQKAMGNFN
ncbi:TolC family protein [Solitalea lacus]|uniref:TolC family protein n=1 Tax=Solitalea lacus TaxID=2911172 RepID=UPI001ED9DCEE|nr:TolC family protein [Solitalea lacus]UKJ05776.1 TolC family protein [Solitalea lacus]